jgi:hypothetical protein
MSNKKQSSVECFISEMSKRGSIIYIRSWVRTNGEMSEDGKSITYSCAELEAVIREAKAMHKDEIEDAWLNGMKGEMIAPLSINNYKSEAEEYYNDTFE